MLVGDNVYLSRPDNYELSLHLACFDLDWTLVRPSKGHFPKTPTDVVLLPGCQLYLQKYIEAGYSIVIFTNQKSTSAKKLQFNLDKIKYALELLNIPCMLYMSTADNAYRKPGVGMWNLLQKEYAERKVLSAFYCGDAAGRPDDFSDSDKLFAENIGIKFKLPGEVLPSLVKLSRNSIATPLKTFDLPTETKMILFVGMPGVGKTTFYRQYFSEFVHANQDHLKTKAKVLTCVKQSLAQGLSVVVDCTNPGENRRQEFYRLAKAANAAIIVIHFVGNGKERNKLRAKQGLKPVPNVAYSMYFKYLIEPTITSVPGDLYQIYL